MNMDYTQEDNILIQSYFTIAFLAELINNNFLKSDCYKKMQFQDKFIKENLPSIGIDNRGNLLITLYTMLIIPKEFLFDTYPTEFEKLNDTIENIKSEANSSYKYDQKKINYIRHIRNAIAHLRVEFVDKAVKFTDEYKKNKKITEKCTITIPLMNVGTLLTELQKIFMKHIETLQVKMNELPAPGLKN